MNGPTDRFVLPARILHWLMAALILAMLFIGAGMVSTVNDRYPELLAWHRPIGIAILILAVIRLGVRVTHRPPPLPADVPAMQAAAARASHYVLYGLMIAMPLIGWAMQSAGGYPVVMWKGFDLYPILPHNIIVYGQLRRLHGLFAYAFFLLILVHLAAALVHAWIRRDGVFQSMSGGSRT
ncbi:Cytochrome B561 [Caballeronia glathei]|jgi:cytochrome b561|uniref:Cytochrome B561 n=1 Tax=Caballeronia glathei TaxID=60547 RepID=A0A069PE34_9BURK|nr:MULTISPECIES: cytochrome b [Burkholderiaceae]KDR38963.1 cytochrome B561 [Caballeronia glathei]TCK36409.1 cytochrome b561 [Paraburkholderia sp. BL8N3]CDY77253.1 Cytochrome B561 [Caballeronia glathei]